MYKLNQTKLKYNYNHANTHQKLIHQVYTRQLLVDPPQLRLKKRLKLIQLEWPRFEEDPQTIQAILHISR
jgi:hypothetical protein